MKNRNFTGPVKSENKFTYKGWRHKLSRRICSDDDLLSYTVQSYGLMPTFQRDVLPNFKAAESDFGE